jgi:hypothetical protein
MLLTAKVREAAAHDELLRQAGLCRTLGSPFVAAVLEAGHRQILRAPLTAALMAGWPGDPAAAALAMRFNGALHALARRNDPASLGALYRGEHDDFDGAIGAALAMQDAFVAEWMRHPTQTNEVGRAASLIAALTVARQVTGCPFELLELGASCGLNLNLGHYSYDLGGVRAGEPGSPVHIAPQWRGAPPPAAGAVAIAAAQGVDLRPLDPADFATRERLLSFVWADQPARAARLESALAIAQRFPPRIERADAAGWLAARLGQPQPAGLCRVVMHSMVAQYLSEADREAMLGSLHGAGRQATAERPLAWISFEWTRDRREVQLWLTCWPGGTARQLATCHPYGDWIDWHG